MSQAQQKQACAALPEYVRPYIAILSILQQHIFYPWLCQTIQQLSLVLPMEIIILRCQPSGGSHLTAGQVTFGVLYKSLLITLGFLVVMEITPIQLVIQLVLLES
jgi:hypothetical protein